jgi:hypothetical protein
MTRKTGVPVSPGKSRDTAPASASSIKSFVFYQNVEISLEELNVVYDYPISFFRDLRLAVSKFLCGCRALRDQR